ncbi:AbrB/MazE/SpoVT family DNA-binding domain-containing protein [Gracilimonas mengyeensis]|uniref:Transcriptional regulator, AbrB family n=1 Tax=Gracilimonas mengyeensis TaxID=1302730 RepID=A0A521CDU0_9BACT|nr:AbrB/MazE/SpoVT family DNA-binding domain-containing protein [Gracilimonas mengyeensis]SMO57572.1 transcriptional regulator, AbrB family [Gracilimonas mengyeensis]
MPTATLTSKGQVTIPKKIRDKLNLKPGDKINFDIEAEGDVKMSTSKKSILEAAGKLHRPGQKPLSQEEMDEKLAEYVRDKFKSQ